MKNPTFWKILGISLGVHILVILTFRGVVIHSKPAPSFPHTRFVMFEVPGDVIIPGQAPLVERHYRVPTQSVNLSPESENAAPAELELRDNNDTLGSPESLFAHYLKIGKGGMNFFGLRPEEKNRTVFLIDISGSMLQHSGTSTRLTQAYDELKRALACLRPDQSFNIILFAERVSAFSPQPLKATRDNILRAYRYLDSDVDCGGSTNLQGGIRLAVAMKPDSLVLLTDGIPTSSEPQALLTETRFLREKTDRQIRIHSIGFYLKAGSVEESFLMKLAEENNGTYLRWNPQIDLSRR